MKPAPSGGLLLGLAAVLIFSATLPMTRLAVIDLHPAFIAIGRAAIAGLLAAALLAVWRPRPPSPREWRLLAETALGVVIGFPLFMSIAMQDIPAAQGAIITGLVPLATAVAALLLTRERPGRGFWLFALLGTALVIAYAVGEGGALSVGNGSMLAAVAFAALGYARGGALSRTMDGVVVICWALLLTLPLSLPITLWSLHQGWAFRVDPGQVAWASWAGFAYVSVFSMWIGFFFWYRGLALGGVARVGQTQLLQPFFSVLIAAMLLDEPLTFRTVGFAVAVVAVVWWGRRMR